ncbi:MAG: hypothetical protein PHU85_00565 [Phycisphaerae bacterium]|nr:hypothetical protein [Phycisphaerae bacterium]
MRIGPESWQWVTIDSPEVPMGGHYGDVATFAEAAERRGLKLAWSRLWQCFCLYQELPGGHIRDHHHFCTSRARPMPLDPEWLNLFDKLREMYVGISLDEGLKRVEAEVLYEQEAERLRQEEAMQGDVMDSVTLGMGLRTPRRAILVPGRR